MLDQLDKVSRINSLFDFYEALLTEKQCNYLKFYYLENYSIGEIAVYYSISRNAVHDQLKKAVTRLEDYEAKLKYYQKHLHRIRLLNEIKILNKEIEIEEKIDEILSIE